MKDYEKKIQDCLKKGSASDLMTVMNHYSRDNRKRGNHLNVNGFPKSGTSYLYTLLSELTGYSKNWLHDTFPHSEYIMRYRRFLDIYEEDCVFHTHYLGSGENIHYYRKFGIKPVIMVRNIYDVMLSLRDSIINNPKCIDLSNIWIVYLTEDFRGFSFEKQMDNIIDMSLGWYMKFYLTWYFATIKKNEMDVIWLKYEDLVSSTVDSLRTVCNFYNLDQSKEDIDKAIKSANQLKVQTNFNKGVIGRGNELLTQNQKEKINSFIEYYPDVDFSLIGL